MRAVLFGLLLILSGLLLLTVVRIKALHLKYEISGLQQEKGELMRRKKELELELALLTSPAEIERRAKAELGMRYPRAHEVIVIGVER
ncbi:MAG: hypothetical protein DRG31_04250 [Deltaproteobacteria bacterium]|nr:MAG: hypothetical protein DRG31_04250 [Deltaproteobacteria bacterium]